MKKKFLVKRLFIFLLFVFSDCSFAEKKYFLCGPDEDGCFAYDFKYCLCMPYDEGIADQPYCLDFNTVSCLPLSKHPNCDVIFQNESDCVATAFQSEAIPPCPIQTEDFCKQHHVPICAPDSPVSSCVENIL